MATEVLNVKVEQSVKKEAKKLAGELGLTLSSLVNGYLRQFIKTKTVHFSAEEKPTPYLIAAIKEAEADYKNGRTLSFDGPESALDYVKEVIEKNEKKQRRQKR